MDQALLLRSWARRRKWEADLQAAAIWSVLSGSVGKKGKSVSLDEFAAALGGL